MNTSESLSAACPVCFASIPKNAYFCTQCGTQLAHCPICKNLVLTGPTTCAGCGAQLCLPGKKQEIADPSISMQFQDATIFFRHDDKQTVDPSPLQQPAPAEHPPFPDISQPPKDEMLPTGKDSVSLPQEQRPAGVQEQLTETENGITRVGQRLGNYQIVNWLVKDQRKEEYGLSVLFLR